MKELKEFDIVLENGRTSFCGGEMMRGYVVVHFEDLAEMRNIQIRFYGEGFSQLDNVHGSANKEKKKKESIVDLQKVLFGLKAGEIAERIPLHKHGRHGYDFSFMVPKYVPCSFESPKDRDYGLAYIRYFLEATITRPWKRNLSKSIVINVNEVIDTALPEYSYRPGCQTQKELGMCFPDGTLYIEAYLNDICYNQSSTILITCRAENDSKRIMSSVYAKLFKRTRYRHKKETTTYLEVVAEYFGDRVLPKEIVSWENLEFKIPAVGPTISKSNRINVDYFLRVGMYQLFRDEIHVDLPIVIGTTKAFLLEKRRTEEELNQELSISVDPLFSDEYGVNEADRQKIRELAEISRHMPFVGNRPGVQYITAEERRNRRDRKYLSTPRLEVLDESDDFLNGEQQSDISKSTDLLYHDDYNDLPSNEMPNRRASETNLYVASNRQGATGGHFAQSTPRKEHDALWPRGSTPRENDFGRPSVRKAASHSSIENRQFASPVSIEDGKGKRSTSARKSPVKQQTGRKHVTQKKLDMKEIAAVAAGLSDVQRSIKVNFRPSEKKRKEDGSNLGASAAEQGATVERSKKMQAEQDGKANRMGLGTDVDIKGENDSQGIKKNIAPSSPKDASQKAANSLMHQSNESTASAATKGKLGSTGQPKETNKKGVVGLGNSAVKAAQNQSLSRSKAKASAVSAFAKGPSKTLSNANKSMTKNAVGKGAADRNKVTTSKETSVKARKDSTASNASSQQSQTSVTQSSMVAKDAAMLRKNSSLSSINRENGLKGNSNEVTNAPDQQIEAQMNIIQKQNNEDIANNNFESRKVVGEEIITDMKETKVEAGQEFDFDNDFNEDSQDHSKAKTDQGRSQLDKQHQQQAKQQKQQQQQGKQQQKQYQQQQQKEGGKQQQQPSTAKASNSQRFSRSNTKVSAVNAFAKRPSKTLSNANKSMTKTIVRKDTTERKKMAASKEASAKLREDNNAINTSSKQSQKGVTQGSVEAKDPALLRKSSSVSNINRETGLTGKTNIVTKAADQETENKRKETTKQNDENGLNNNTKSNKAVDEDIITDVKEGNVEASQDIDFDTVFNENDQDRGYNKADQVESKEIDKEPQQQQNYHQQQQQQQVLQKDSNIAQNMASVINNNNSGSKMHEKEFKDQISVGADNTQTFLGKSHANNGNDRSRDTPKLIDFGASNILANKAEASEYAGNGRENVNLLENDIVPTIEQGNVEASAFSFEDWEKEFAKGESEGKRLKAVEENDIVPSAEAANVETSAFSFEDLDKDFMAESSRRDGSSKDKSVDESLISIKGSNSNLERAPSLDEFELFESQILGAEEIENDTESLSDNFKGKENSYENSSTANNQMLEHLKKIERPGKSVSNDLYSNGYAGSANESFRSSTANADSKNSREEVADKIKNANSLTNRKSSLTTNSTATRNNRKTSNSLKIGQRWSQNADEKIGGREQQLQTKSSVKDSTPASTGNVVNNNLKQETDALDGYTNGQDIELSRNMKSTDIYATLDDDGQSKRGKVEITDADGLLKGIDINADMSNLDGDKVQAEASASNYYAGQANAMKGTHTDENKNDINGALNAKIAWQRTFTKMRTLQATNDSRRKSIVSIRVVNENP